MSNISQSREQLKALGINTTYAVAGQKDGKFVILDTNPDRVAVNRRKPDVLPLCYSRRPVKYETYTDAFNAIVQDIQRENLK